MAGGSKVALDFAITSPTQLSEVGPSSRKQLAAAEAYEKRKLEDRDTAARCAALGIKLEPVIVESFSGVGPMAQKVFKVIARASALRTGLPVGVATSRLYEGLSTRIMRANARALLARITRVVGCTHSHSGSRARRLLRATAV